MKSVRLPPIQRAFDDLKTEIVVVVVSECIDWVAIHQREFDKMDSLDVYVKKREERRRRLKTPVKRAAAFAAKIAVGQQQLETNATKVCTQKPDLIRKGKEKYLYRAIYTMPSLSHSFTCKSHNACLSFISVHQMASSVSEVADIQLQLTTHLLTPKG